MSARDPHEEYRRQLVGEHPGRYDAEAQVWYEGPRLLLEMSESADPLDGYARVRFEASKPDARIALRVDVGFEAGPWGLDSTWAFVPVARTLRSALADTTIWLAACGRIGGVMHECEDLVGTEAAPIQLVRDGLWGALYEADVDCAAIRGRMDIRPTGAPGRWFVRAKWAAIAPVSDRDWRHAREKMQLTVQSDYTVPVGTLPPEPPL